MATIIVPVPTLSFSGWVKSTAEKADYVFSHFYLSERSQTALYRNQVSSLQWIIQNKQGDMTGTCQLIRETLGAYFGRYFKNVSVEVTFKEDPPNTGKVLIKMFIAFFDDEGKEFNLTRLAELENSKFAKIRKLNNEGLPF
jgi:hypothetical protein